MEENPVNPYQSPLASLMEGGMGDAGLESSRPSYKLYTIGPIVLATFLGAPLAGGIVMSINYRRLGCSGKAMHAVMWSAVATAVILAIAIFLPDDLNIPNIVFVIPQLIAMYLIAKALQGTAIETHRAAGGPLASAWAAAGIGILSGIGVFACLCAATLVFLG